MPHLIEPAATGRAKCRGCDQRVAAGELRFGEVVPNPFAEGETTHWFHPECGAYKRPEPFLEALATTTVTLEDAERLEAEARFGLAHERLSRINGAERSPTGRAQCRSCKEPIVKDAWRITLVFYEEGRFSPAGYVHIGCCQAYFEMIAVMPRLRRFSPSLREEDLLEIQAELDRGTAT
jgi:Poly(ADP-ribose) polymerase and DNA-Ligase Zn-finger region